MYLKEKQNKIEIIGFIFSLIILSTVAFYSLVVFWPLNNKIESINFEVKKGSSLKQIAEDLIEKKIIEDSQTFVLAATMMGHEKSIRSGIISIRNLNSNYNLITQLVKGNPVLEKITFPEGLTINQISNLLEKKLNINKQDFLDLCNNKKFIKSFDIKASSLEGFLLPETYYFQKNEKPDVIINKMIKEYKIFFKQNIAYRLKEINFRIINFSINN